MDDKSDMPMRNGGSRATTVDNSAADEAIRQRYHGKRRNATFGTLRSERGGQRRPHHHNYHDTDRYDAAGGDRDDATDATSDYVHRTRGGGIQHRHAASSSSSSSAAAGFASSRNKYSSINRRVVTSKWRDVDAPHSDETSNGHASARDERSSNRSVKHRNITWSENLRLVNPQSRLKATSSAVAAAAAATTYKIGDVNGVEKKMAASLPHCKLATMDQSVFDLIVTFLQQYFMCYDKNRNDLLAAYHPRCMFSMSINTRNQSGTSCAKFAINLKDSRNLKFASDQELFTILHNGSIDTVAFLSRLPPSEHFSDSLKLDTTFSTQHMVSFSVVGIYREGRTSDDHRLSDRTFQRVFVCVPTGDGKMVIVNDQLTISNLSSQQAKVYKEKMATARHQQQQQQQQSIETNAATRSQPLGIDSTMSEVDQQNLKILEFSKFSNLNLTWSRDCLSFANWDYELAKRSFIEHRVTHTRI